MYVLILVMSLGNYGITSVRVDEYVNIEQCRAAGTSVLRIDPSPVKMFVCVPGGKKAPI
jgi:hypothetical protein